MADLLYHTVSLCGRYRGGFDPDSGRVVSVEEWGDRRWKKIWWGMSCRTVPVDFVVRETEKRFAEGRTLDGEK